MKVLLVSVPSRRHSVDMPHGLCYVAGILEVAGYASRILDLALDDPSLASFSPDMLDEEILDFQPDVIGYGGIATGYGRTKALALHIREHFPQLRQIAGGPLASVAELLLTQARLDAVFHGEVETSLPRFMARLATGGSFADLEGISVMADGAPVRRSPMPREDDLDRTPTPAYGQIELERYVENANDWVPEHVRTFEAFPKVRKHWKRRVDPNPRCLQIMTKRGCTHHCLFCYRHVRGAVRTMSVDRVIRQMRDLRERLGLGGFQLCDECFNHDEQWVMDFCETFRSAFPDGFYIVAGARVDRMTDEMLCALYESGCVQINYGQESGAAQILKEYRKGVSVADNLEVTRKTLEAGILTAVQLVFGGPSETIETVRETVDFLRETGVRTASINYLIPLPETPSWKLVEERGLVKDVEHYLDVVAESGGAGPVVNLTQCPVGDVETWAGYIRLSMDAEYCRDKGDLSGRYWRLLRRVYLRQPAWLRHLVRRCRVKKA